MKERRGKLMALGRFAVANVSDEVVSKVPGRLEMLNGLAGELGWTVKDD